MAKAPRHSSSVSATRRHILRAALKRFADGGYAATSVQQIVDDASLSKPTLYYHFQDKAALFEALVNEAHDGRFRVLQEASARATGIRGQLCEMLVALFEHFHRNRELTRIAFSTAFAAPGEVPPGLCHLDKCRRNLELFHSLIQRAQTVGELDNRFDSWDLAYGFYGQTNFYVTAHLLIPDYCLDRAAAERVVDLFLVGAAAKGRRNHSTSQTRRCI